MTEVTPVGHTSRVAIYALCVVMVLSGPGFVALGMLLDAHPAAYSLIGSAMSLVLVPLGVALWIDVRATARRMRRLRAAGVAATAEVLAVRPSGHAARTRVRLNLRISAPGLEPFEALHTRDRCDKLLVGTTLKAVVDPAGRFYAVS